VGQSLGYQCLASSAFSLDANKYAGAAVSKLYCKEAF
jgi:hypothetical protein